MKQKQKAFKYNSRMIAAGLAIVVFGTAILVSTNAGKKILGIQVKSSPTYAQTGKFRTAKDPIKDQYIVVLKDSVDPSAESTRLAGRYNSKANHVYADAIKGFSAHLTEAQAQAISEDVNVQWVEEDGKVTHTYSEPATYPSTYGPLANWALDRIDQHDLNLDHIYNYNTTGNGVNLYIIDSGVWVDNPDFGGRAVDATSTAGAFDPYKCNSHGTGVAGTAAGTTIGPAKGAKIYSVNIYPCTGYGTASDAIAGIDWVTRHAIKPAVANMSFQSSLSSTMNTAVQNMISKGIVAVVAAGNNGENACYYSPSSVPGAIVVGATGKDGTNTSSTYDDETVWSNYGSCVSLFAPGLGDAITLNGVDTTASGSPFSAGSGTSFASPMVAGVAATYLEAHPTATPSEVKNAIVQGATPNMVINLAANTPNLILYSLITDLPPTSGPDTTPPTVAFNSPKNGSTMRNKDVTAKVSASDASGISQIVISMDGAILKTCYNLTTCSTTITASTLPVGTHILAATATDNAAIPNTGNTQINIYK